MEVLMESAYSAVLKERGFDGQLSKDTIDKIGKVSRWLTDPTCKPGLILYGGVGNGKTTMLMAINKFLYHTRGLHEMEVELQTAEFISMAPKRAEGYIERIGSREIGLLGIDDLGCEPAIVKDFGNELTPVISVLTARYRSNLPTIITTNLTLDEIKKVYGIRIQDRILETYERIEYKNNSFRR